MSVFGMQLGKAECVSPAVVIHRETLGPCILHLPKTPYKYDSYNISCQSVRQT